MKKIVKIYKLAEDDYEARIDNGWWVARGKTSEDAKRKVIKRFNDELSKYSY